MIETIKTKQDIEISVMAILNDATGTLMSCAWVDRKCRMGVIIGELHVIKKNEIDDLVALFACSAHTVDGWKKVLHCAHFCTKQLLFYHTWIKKW